MNTQGMNDDELFRLQSYHAGMFAAISEVGDVRRKRTVSDLSERQRAESEVEWYEDVSRVVSAMVARIREAPLGSSHDLSLIHISEPTRRLRGSRMPSSA